MSFGFDLIGFCWRGEVRRREFQAVGFYSLLIAAMVAPFAVLSGLFLSRGEMLGQGSLRMHHIFIWPSFGLLICLAVWRLVVRDRASRGWFKAYLAAAGIAAGAMLAGGFWGGELVMGN